MSWKKINLFGYDSEKDDFEKTTFNIKRALNDNWAHIKELLEEARGRIDDKVEKEAGKGLSSNDYTDAEKEKVLNLPSDTNTSLAGKAEKPAVVLGVLTAQNWNQTDKAYSFESAYPAETYDIAVEPDSTCSEEQLEAWSNARIVGSASGNVLKAYGDIPTVDIPVILEVKLK